VFETNGELYKAS
jgi:DNA-directed RNA polymerase